MEICLQLHEFFVEGKNPEKSHVLLNVTEPTTAKEKEKGYFFAICEITDGTNKYILKLQDIIDEIENSYYEVVDENEKTSLEIVLDKINQRSFTLLRTEDAKLNCVVGAIRQQQIVFAYHGQPHILLFYKSKQDGYRKLDLIAENTNNGEDEGDKFLFSQIIEGKIGSDDFFFASTSQVANYFSHDRLQKIITTRPPRQSAEHLQRVLTELKSQLSFGGIILHFQKDAAVIKIQRKIASKKGTSDKSLKKMFNTEKNTASILSSSLWPRLNSLAANLKTSAKDEAESEQMNKNEVSQSPTLAEIGSPHLRVRQAPSASSASAKTVAWQQILIACGKIVVRAIKQIIQAVSWLAIIIAKFAIAACKNIILFFFVIINYQNRRKNIINDWSRTFKYCKQKIKELPNTIKILMILAVLLLFALIGSVFYMKKQQDQKKEEQIFAAEIQLVKSKTDSAESSIIYNDLEAANNDLKSAKQTLDKLNCDNDVKKQQLCQQLNQKVETVLKKVRKIHTVTPAVQTDWGKFNAGYQAQKIFSINKKIIGWNKTNSNIFIFNQLSQSSEVSSINLSDSAINATAVPKEEDYAVLLAGDKLAKYDPKNNSWKTINISLPNQEHSIQDSFIYSRRLYLLDPMNNQIYRHDPTNSGFADGREWLKNKNNVDIKNAVSFAIDGDVFVLSNNGQVKKFSNGEQQTFKIIGLDPELASANQIWTYYELAYIYILDSTGKRIIVLNKNDGTLKKQITANEWAGPSSMIIDEINGMGYVLDSNKLYKIDLGL